MLAVLCLLVGVSCLNVVASAEEMNSLSIKDFEFKSNVRILFKKRAAKSQLSMELKQVLALKS
jgi:hypothetical protein